MWSKQSETLIDNSVAYVLQNKLNIVVGANQASINYDQQIETEVSLANSSKDCCYLSWHVLLILESSHCPSEENSFEL
jgi:hypothetical protein